MLGYSNGSAMTLHYLLEGSYKLNNVLCNVTVFSDEQWDGEDKLLSLSEQEEVKPDLSNTKITFCMGGEDTIIPFNGGEFLEEYIHPSLDVINFLASYKEGSDVEEVEATSLNKNLDLYCYKKQDVALYYFLDQPHNMDTENSRLLEITENVLVNEVVCFNILDNILNFIKNNIYIIPIIVVILIAIISILFLVKRKKAPVRSL